jgi:hypothetical protein
MGNMLDKQTLLTWFVIPLLVTVAIAYIPPFMKLDGVAAFYSGTKNFSLLLPVYIFHLLACYKGVDDLPSYLKAGVLIGLVIGAYFSFGNKAQLSDMISWLQFIGATLTYIAYLSFYWFVCVWPKPK